MQDDIEIIEEEEIVDESTVADKLKKVRGELLACKKDRDEHLAGWQRAKADYINLQKEMNERVLVQKEKTVIHVVSELLPTLDAFTLAMKDTEAWNQTPENWRQGIEYIYKELLRALTTFGVEVIDSTDVPFNPLLHQAVETTGEGTEEYVDTVLQSGYTIGNTVIRAARVRVRLQ